MYSGIESALLAAVVASSNDAIVTKNLDGVITTWNAAATRIFGYQPDEMIGQSITRIIPEHLRAEEDDILARLRRGERVEHFDTIRKTRDGRHVPVSLTISPLKDSDGHIMGASKIARDISERKLAEERQRLLLNELKHRVKNILSTVNAIARQTYSDPQLTDKNDTFSRRIAALAASSDLLVKNDWEHARLSEIVAAVVEPFCAERASISVSDSPELELTPRQASSIALALNELATNATKHGALSHPAGHVLLSWQTEASGAVTLSWVERGGPPVSPPQHSGFGTTILSEALKHELNAETALRYPPEGFEFVMRF